MRNLYVIFACILLAFTSCKTREKVVYLQNLQPNESVSTQPMNTLKIMPGDKIGVTVSSVATPDLAVRYNLSTGTNTSSTQNADNLRYTIDENGNADILGIGRINLQGLTRAEATTKIQNAFQNGLLKDAVVTVATYNQYITILGDVSRPGRYEINRDNITLLDAIGMAGDLNITGRRDAIKVIRTIGNETQTYFVDIRSKSMFNSPAFNLQQNDIIYVEPNNVKIGQSTNNDNSLRSISTWLSISSFLLSMGILIFK